MLFNLNGILSAPQLYLDPGSGSLLIQLLLAAVLGISVAIKVYWTKLKGLFGGNKIQDNKSIDEENRD